MRSSQQGTRPDEILVEASAGVHGQRADILDRARVVTQVHAYRTNLRADDPHVNRRSQPRPRRSVTAADCPVSRRLGSNLRSQNHVC